MWWLGSGFGFGERGASHLLWGDEKSVVLSHLLRRGRDCGALLCACFGIRGVLCTPATKLLPDFYLVFGGEVHWVSFFALVGFDEAGLVFYLFVDSGPA